MPWNLVKILAFALKEFPILNSAVVGDEIICWDEYHIGVAVAIPDGLITPVVRDASGLAYAARNYFLNAAQLAAAPVIHRSLQAAESALLDGETQAKKIVKQVSGIIESEPLATLEYVIVANPDTLEPLNKIQDSALIGVGARIGETSLDDSLLFERTGGS